MMTRTNIGARKLTLQTLLSSLLVVIVVLAFASKGGGDKRKEVASRKNFVPIDISSTFTLKNGVSYMGSRSFGQQKERTIISVNSVIAYQNKNTIYVMPYKYKISIAPLTSPSKTNMQFLDFKIGVHK